MLSKVDGWYSVVADVSVSTVGTLAASLSVLSSCGQQIGVAYLAKKYSLSSTALLGKVFLWQVCKLVFYSVLFP